MAVDNAAEADAARAPVQPSKWRLGGALWLLGMPGVVAVVWALFPTLKANEALLPLPLPLGAVLLLSGLQTAMLLALAVTLGVWLAPRVGLRVPAVSCLLVGQPIGPALRAQLVPGMVGGVAGAAWLWALSQVAPTALQPSDPASAMPLGVKLLYGGITEELLVRRGMMTLLLWLGWRVLQRGQRQPGKVLVVVAVLLSALLFAFGHLPAAQALAGVLTMPVVAFVLVGNTVFGLVAGWLYARHGLESAIIAHVLAHLLSFPVL
ncbi:CPBP family glutamic-type intramembrane protease [Acidovorax sp.]|uniref:CPBP family glutamic-type intramembrane protease n=1 Tax=Acidovorax sp. TaxID=1872122 RepID=UPI0025B9012F|nr:CPBP family glutamic-type intramembrane protease [Acidovorax sp.]MBL7088129.1 CPBP family intramembrane metalloprotease [Acidovorax sp.]